MLINTILHYLLELAVLVTLVSTLLYTTKAIKAKDDKDEKIACRKKAGLFFVAYILLYALTLYLQSVPK